MRHCSVELRELTRCSDSLRRDMMIDLVLLCSTLRMHAC